MKLTIAKGSTVKEIVITFKEGEDGTPLIKVGRSLTGISTPHPFSDVRNGFAEVVPQANFTYIAEHSLEVEVNGDACVVSSAKEVFFKLVV